VISDLKGIIPALSGHPMQGQSGHKKEEYQHHAQLDEKQQDQSSELFLVDFEEMCRPSHGGVPEQDGRCEIEKREYKADDECGEQKAPEEDDFVAVHVAIIYFSEARSITKRLWKVNSLTGCRLRQGFGVSRKR
jgi:hypothetical protein